MLDTPRFKILKLEKENKWVFHGSAFLVDKIEPRQAYSSKTGTRIPDGNPAVFATPIADIAIFMAVFNKENMSTNLHRKYKSGFTGEEDGGVEFRVTKDLMDDAINFNGYVYVFDKNKFKPRSSFEVLSDVALTPEDVICVTEKDLPNNIQIKDF